MRSKKSKTKKATNSKFKEWWIEWFSVYGWSILIVLAVIGILWWQGILSWENALPKGMKIDRACEKECEAKGMMYGNLYDLMDNESYNCKCIEIPNMEGKDSGDFK